MLRRTFVLVWVGLGGLWSSACGPARKELPTTTPVSISREAPPPHARWKEIDRLIEDQKLEEASRAAEELLAEAKAKPDPEEWTRALVRLTQLRMALHGDETAVRFLREQPWPESPVHRVVLNLYYATALRSYAAQYGWELRQRERVDTQGAVELKRWSFEQVSEAQFAALAEAWAQRESLGDVPVTRFGEYLEPGTYPEQVRGTMRDAVTYLLAGALADSSAWTPAQSNGAYQIPLESLLGAGDGRLGDATVHPLLRMAAVLDDLEQWHAKGGRREAQLEARLERVRLLSMHRTAKEDAAALRADLEARVPKFRDVPWFAAGKAAIASLWQNAGDLVKAREQAREGQQAYPSSVGGKQCEAMVTQIEAPDYQLNSMAVDGLKRRSIQLQHRNLPALYLRAYRLDLDARLEKTPNEPLPDDRELRKLIASEKPAAAWKVALPATPDYQQHVTYDVPPLPGHGTYAIAASAREDFGTEQNRIVSTFLHAGALTLSVTHEPDGSAIDVRVVQGEDGRGVSGATVELRAFSWQTRQARTERFRTDANGYARIARPSATERGGAYFVSARLGDERVVLPSAVGFHRQDEARSLQSTLVYTDRSVYRPQQKVQWKVVAFGGAPEAQRYRTRPGTPLKVDLIDPNGEVVATTRVTTNGFGSAAGEFVIPTGRILGGWTVSAGPGSTGIQVEEYKRPTFEVTFPDAQQELRLNTAGVVRGEARYHFGLPVTQGTARWTVKRVPRFPWWWFWRPSRTSTEVIASGESKLRDDGSFEIAFTPKADARAKQQALSYAFEVEAAVTDEGGETRSATRTSVLGFTSVEAQLTASAGFFEPGRAPAFDVARRDLDGKPRAGEGRYRVVRLAQPSAPVLPSEAPPFEPPMEGADPRPEPLTPGDRLSPRWGTGAEYAPLLELRRWADAEQVAAGQVRHGEDGAGRVALAGLPPGAYRLHYETTDDGGNVFKTQDEFIVAGGPLMLPLVALVQDATVKPGGTVRVLVTSGFRDQEIVVELRRQGGRAERRVLRAGTDAGILELPVREEDRGGLSLTATALRDYQSMSLRHGVTVPFDHKELQVSFETFRDRIRPGAKEQFKVRVRGPDGARVDTATAELLAYMYDRSLDYFAPHTPWSVAALYSQRHPYAWTISALGQGQTRWLSASDFPRHVDFPELTPASLKGIEGYGIGGMGVRRGMLMKAVAAPAPGSAARSFESLAQAPAAEAQGVSDAAAPPPPPAPPATATPPADALRQEFSETAFFAPQLRLAADGSATIEFTVPDSVTSWNVWVHALTQDLAGGSAHRETRSIKELMVRPYLPRFLREGDEATLEVVLNSAASQPLGGRVTIEVFDAATNAPAHEAFALAQREAAFQVAPGKSAKVSFALKAPRAVGTYGFRVRASAGDFADGEQRALPVLPGRMHLAQSRFVPLREGQAKTMTFADLAAGDDPSLVTEQLVVTIDAQLFYTALQALPYLVNYPYECTEQTLNRFVSSGILSSLYERHPAVAKMAKQLSTRKTELEAWDAPDPNRRMLLEESPWLQEAKGGTRAEDELLAVLDPAVSRAQRASSIADLRKAQQPDGAFPWFPGGPPSPYMTLYVMAGLARAAEYQVPVPKEVTQQGWSYLAQHFRTEQAPRLKKEECCLEFLTFLNFVASSYPDASYTGDALTLEERQQIADYTFTHWRKLSPYLKGMLALTLHRMDRSADGRTVFASVMDSAKTTEELGTYWAPEDRSWLWYNDTIESHAFALRVLMELSPKDARRHGLVQWLLLNKKLSHWKSTRATAEVLYALAKYLESEGALGVSEQVRVQVAGRTVDLAFSPEKYTGKKNQIVVPGEEVRPKEHADIRVEKKGKGLAFASATWHFATDKLPTSDQGDFFQVSRRYFLRSAKGTEITLRPIGEGEALKPGDEVEVQLSIRAKHAAEYVHLHDPRAAGLEPDRATSGYKWDLGLGWYEETRDSATNFFFDWLPAGEYTLRYRVRASMAGTFRIGPATLQSLYAPEFNAYSAGQRLTIAGAAK